VTLPHAGSDFAERRGGVGTAAGGAPAPLRSAVSAVSLAEEVEIEALLRSKALVFSDYRGDEDELLEAVTDRLAAGNVVAWHQGRVEAGAHLCEGRVLLASAQSGDAVRGLRSAGERPGFPRRAVAVPGVALPDETGGGEPLIVREGGRLARLLRCFERRTDFGYLLGVSMPASAEPAAVSPEETLRTFLRRLIGALVLEDFVVDRAHLPLRLRV
jgi:carbamoyltransferase